MLTLTRRGQKAILDAVSGNGTVTPFSNITIGLYGVGSNLSIGVGNDAGVLYPVYPGYANQPGLPFIASFVDGTGKPTIASGELTFRPTSNGNGTLVGGSVILEGDGTGGNLLGWSSMESPKNMATTDDVITVEPRLSLDPTGDFGDFDFSI